MGVDVRRGGGSAATAVKLEHFERVIGQELRMAWAAINKPHPEWPGWRPRRRVLYMDLNAGPGYVGPSDDDLAGLRCSDPRPEALRGSPLIALRASLDAEIPTKLVLCERNPDHIRALREALIDELMDWRLTAMAHDSRDCRGCSGCDRWKAEEWIATLVTILDGDHNETIPDFLATHRTVWQEGRPFFGLFFADPYGIRDLPIGPLRALSSVPSLRRCEVLVNVSATAQKRSRGAGQTAAYLFDALAPIQRAYRWIREPVDQWQWTMMLATNSREVKPLRSMGFRDVTTTEGRALVDRLNLSERERREARCS